MPEEKLYRVDYQVIVSDRDEPWTPSEQSTKYLASKTKEEAKSILPTLLGDEKLDKINSIDEICIEGYEILLKKLTPVSRT